MIPHNTKVVQNPPGYPRCSASPHTNEDLRIERAGHVMWPSLLGPAATLRSSATDDASSPESLLAHTLEIVTAPVKRPWPASKAPNGPVHQQRQQGPKIKTTPTPLHHTTSPQPQIYTIPPQILLT